MAPIPCPTCGAVPEADARFCGTCGGRLGGSDVESVPTQPRDVARSNPQAAAFKPPAASPKPSSTPPPAPSTPPPAQATPPPTAGPPRPLDRLMGRTLNNRYQVQKKIGEGGFGAVFEGKQVATGRECALKILHPHNV